MEDILAILLIFGGGTAVAISFSPVGRAIADRIRHRAPLPEQDPAVYEELERLRAEMIEVHERLDFTERLLARGSDQAQPVEEK
ncbi:MAG: hypothetical protein OEW17_08465 [Gemmatimonadota bacterium]|nr:hypothetical protein [Gemmatimonadota bacterium]MDH4348825.1 hypothetical protein [Gemmatimonadota bacterium]MDH5284178.1 hypothetical protein [Gemmatimonadota bacterium]